jgi:AraC-like DNA-binding protein
VAAPVAASMLLEAASRGLSIDAWLRRLGLDEASLTDPERRVPFPALFEVWAECMRSLGDPGLPLAAAQRVRLEDYAVLGFATTSAPTFRVALSLLARYGSLHADGCRWVIKDASLGISLVWEREGARTLGHRVANECAIAEALHAARQILGFTLVPSAVCFRHPAPRALRAHEQFFGVRPRFDAPWEGIVFPSDVLDRTPRRANAPLASWLERQMETMLARRRDPETIAERVERLLEQEIAGGEPDLERVATALGMSERTLRRQLEPEQQTFRGLWEAVRRRRAQALLSAGEVTIDEVAFLTGFSETSAFARAFKRWTGDTPAAYRRSHSADRIGQEVVRVGQGSAARS